VVPSSFLLSHSLPFPHLSASHSPISHPFPPFSQVSPSRSTDSELRGCGPKTWGVLGSVKMSLSAMHTPIRQKRPNFRIPYFRPSKCRSCTVTPGAHAHFAPPFPAASVRRRVFPGNQFQWYLQPTTRNQNTT